MSSLLEYMTAAAASVVRSVAGESVVLSGPHVSDSTVSAVCVTPIEVADIDPEMIGPQITQSRRVLCLAEDVTTPASYSQVAIAGETWDLADWAMTEGGGVVAFRATRVRSVDRTVGGHR